MKNIKNIFFVFVLMFALFFCLFLLNGWHIEFSENNLTETTIEYGEKIQDKPLTAYLKGKYLFKDGIKIETSTTNNINQEKIGHYKVKYNASFLFWEKEIISCCNIVDTQPPEIILKNVEDYYAIPDEKYEEEGFLAYDNYDGDITDKVISYTEDNFVYYIVVDSSGNLTTKTRNILKENEEKRLQNEHISIKPDKVIYLTFDDGPSKYTKDLLEILRKHNVKATFFVVNSAYNDIISEIYKEGHSIGIHSYTHEYEEIYSNEESYFEDLNKIREVIYNKTGYYTKLVRFPGGSSNSISKRYNKGIMTRLSKLLEEQGYQYFDWNVSSGDAEGTTKTEEIYNNVISGINNKKTVIVLQHDTKKYSIDAVENIIIWGKENGYTFLPLTINSPTSHHKISN